MVKYEEMKEETKQEWFIKIFEDELRDDFINYSNEFEEYFLKYIEERFKNITEDEIKQIMFEVEE